MKSVFTHEFKEKVVAAYLQEFKKNPNLEFRPFVRSNFPELKPKTAYNWLVLYKEAIGKKQGMSENEVSGVYGTQASAMSLKEKFMMIIETAAMNEEQIGEYCRKHGIYKSDLDSWKNECSQALDEGYSHSSIIQQRNEIKELKQKVTKLEKENLKKDRQIDKKDRVLATYAAQVITLKNFQKLFTDNNEED